MERHRLTRRLVGGPRLGARAVAQLALAAAAFTSVSPSASARGAGAARGAASARESGHCQGCTGHRPARFRQSSQPCDDAAMSQDVRALTNDLARNAWSLAAIALAAERGLLSAVAAGPCSVEELARKASIADPTARALADTLAALGLVALEGERVRDSGALAPFREQRAANVLAAEIRSILGTTRDAAYAAAADGPVEGWRAVDPVAVRAQGIVSNAVTLSLAPMLQAMPDMHARLSAPGARFLDVGAGAAGLGIAYATLYPTLRVVGVEPSEVACAEARLAIGAAGLADRVEVRQAYGQDLDELAGFAGAYVAQMFIPDDAVDAVWRATARALTPGAWLTTGTIATDGPELAPAVARFRSAIWGGGVRRAQEVVAALERAGFTEVRAMQSPGMVPILARRRGQ